jgi:polyribonucleotide nucleotidyltransferase
VFFILILKKNQFATNFLPHFHLITTINVYLCRNFERKSIDKTIFMINPIVKTIELPDGRTITLETGKLAKQADGSVMLRMGNTMLLATVCAAKDAVPGTDFMPLQVEYKEKFAAFGRFPGGFTKREGRASDYEILTCRLVDRALRHFIIIQVREY